MVTCVQYSMHSFLYVHPLDRAAGATFTAPNSLSRPPHARHNSQSPPRTRRPPSDAPPRSDFTRRHAHHHAAPQHPTPLPHHTGGTAESRTRTVARQWRATKLVRKAREHTAFSPPSSPPGWRLPRRPCGEPCGCVWRECARSHRPSSLLTLCCCCCCHRCPARACRRHAGVHTGTWCAHGHGAG